MYARRLVLLFLLACLPTAWAGPVIQHWLSASGARVYFVQARELPMLDVSVTFAAGSARDVADKSGLARMTQQLMSLGAGAWSEQALAEALADVGAILGKQFDADRAVFTLRTLSEPRAREQALAVLQAVLAQPHFDPAILQREQARAVAGLKEAATRPSYLGEKALQAAMYGDHPYAMDEAGEIETIERLTRDDLLDFHRRHYTARNAVVALVGDVERTEAERIAEALTRALPPGEAAPPLPPVRVGAAGPVRVIPHPASQSHLFLGLPAIARDDAEFFPLVVGNYVLGGGGFDARILKEVRVRRGLAYSAYSTLAPLTRPGPFVIGLQTRREATEEALAAVHDLLAAYLRDGPTEDELAQAKNYLVGSFPLRLDSNRKILDHIGMMGFYALPLDWLTRYPERVAAVTQQDVVRAFRARIRPEALHTVIVGGATAP
ncbi:MAG: insulinase family protein [Thiobacillaceae bacterium]|nr:insulinase family protein [Thiobacillaceae bacterium]